MNRLIRWGLVLGILFSCPAQLWGQGQGQGQGGGQGQVSPVITIAVADLDADPETLSLVGANFGSNPEVFIGNDMGMLGALMVNFATLTDTFIEAELGPIDPGTYLVVVSTGPNQIQMAAMDLTIGAPNPHIITEGSPTFSTAIGVSALISNNGFNNTASGALALASNDTGSFNTASGFKALRDNTTGNQNTAIGGQTLISNTTGSLNTASGVNALGSNTTGNSNTASGHGALGSNTTGSTNTASGVNALNKNTTGSKNTASGHRALFNNTTGIKNTASGVEALLSNTTGIGNTASGVGALLNNTTGSGNTASGGDALLSNTTGSSNTATGSSALRKNTTGNQNTAIGIQALINNTTGKFNTASGVNALAGNTTGLFNIALGYGAGLNATTGDNNIYIGNPGVAAESNIIRIGDNGHTNAFIAGVDVVPLSSKRFKEDIRDMGQGSTSLMRLRPVTFRYKKQYAAGDNRLQYGLIAEEVAEVYPELVVHDDEGRVRTVLYQELNVMLLNELQKQHGQIQDLTERLARLEQTLTTRQLLTALRK